MTRSELVIAIQAEHPHLTMEMTEVLLDTILTAVAQALARGDRVELRGFGAFTAKDRKARIGRNPKTGAPVPVQQKLMPFFKAGKDLRMRLNGRQIPIDRTASPSRQSPPAETADSHSGGDSVSAD